ncbi:MAG TPA: ribonuclease III [Gammaproteobacteria bacterium]|jgi:ribonuclease-3
MSRLVWAEQKLDYEFSDPSLLELALTHRSASKKNNERLEFLGDSFLNFAVARQLYRIRGEDAEGDLSRLRAFLVRGSTLADIGRDLGLDKHLILGSGELRSGGSRRDSVLANCVEALIGAVLLDGGFDAANAFINRLFENRLGNLPDAENLKDSKTRLQEWLQGCGRALPDYAVESSSGEPHQRIFTVVCSVADEDRRARGIGPSRRKAEQDAAERMLAILIGDTE